MLSKLLFTATDVHSQTESELLVDMPNPSLKTQECKTVENCNVNLALFESIEEQRTIQSWAEKIAEIIRYFFLLTKTPPKRCAIE
jgi:hypothetical protein